MADADITVKRIDEMEAIFLGSFKRARAELGVESFGMQVIDIPPNLDAYPAHDHAEDGQEEVFVVMRGGCTLIVDGERFELDPEVIARVGPGATRQVVTGDSPVRLLALGGVPGRAYEPSRNSLLGNPDPMAR
jgi:uncharacterized cupin superfamily protein